MNYQEFKNRVLNKAYDTDGAFGAQCWDGVDYYARCLGHSLPHCGQTGYVKDIANMRKTNGILNWCTDVGLNATLKPGDICVWRNCAACPYSHIAIYDHDNGQNAVYFLGQNQGGAGGAFNVVRIPVNGIIAVFRPKNLNTVTSNPKPVSNTAVLNSKPSDFHPEQATFTVSVASIRIRKAPSLHGADTGLVYKKGNSVHYDGYVIREGYVWISWISASTGERRWMAAGETNSRGVNTNPYGTFR